MKSDRWSYHKISKKNLENYGIFEMWCHTEELDRDAAAW